MFNRLSGGDLEASAQDLADGDERQRADEGQDEEGQVELPTLTDGDARDHPADELQRGVGGAVGDLLDEEHDTDRLEVLEEESNQLEDEPRGEEDGRDHCDPPEEDQEALSSDDQSDEQDDTADDGNADGLVLAAVAERSSDDEREYDDENNHVRHCFPLS